MRPVTRQPWPTNSDGEQISYSSYRSFFTKLIDNFGNVCSYCEVIAKMDIEHVIPKSIEPSLENDWDNFLLGCSSCNRDFKRSNNTNREDYVWPDEIDTFACYTYLSSGDIKVSDDLSVDLAIRADATLTLCQLNPEPKQQIEQPNDYLWQHRALVWFIAEVELEKYQQQTSSAQSIATLALAMGRWSVWVTVFDNHPEVVQAISQKYKGTLAKYSTQSEE